MGKYDTEKAGGKQAVTAIKTLVFSGYSDDTFGEWTTGMDYDNCASMRPITFRIMDGDKVVLYVTGQYSRHHNGCWEISVCQPAEDDIPDIEMSLSFEGYTAVLTARVPSHFRVEHIPEKQR